MPKDKVKEFFTEYWNLFLEGLIVAVLIAGFIEAEPIFKWVAFLIGATDLIILIHALWVEEDPKFLIVDLLIRSILRSSK